MKMKFYLKILPIISFLSCILSHVKAQDRLLYGSECLENIGAKIGCSDAESQEEWQLSGNQSTTPIKAERDKNGVITHLGVDIFGDEIKAGESEILFNFVERYLLELLLASDDLEVSERNQIEEVEIIGSLGSIPRFVSSDLSEISLEVLLQGNRYEIIWSDAQDKFSISFPANYSLLSGKSKIELEDDFYDELQNYSNIHTQSCTASMSEEKLRKIADNVYEYDQGHYMVSTMRNAQYLELSGDTYTYIYNSDSPYESLSNLATLYNASRNSIVLDIKQQKYGSINNEFHYRLNDLVAFCLDEGCTPYISFEQEESARISATIFMVNYDYKYNHMLQLYVEDDDFLEENSVVSCQIHTYIPTHNTSELYDEANQVNSKHKIKL